MATILRSSKYFRCLNGFAQRIVVAHDKSNYGTKCLATQAQSINSYLTKGYGTIAATQSKEVTTNFDSAINALDAKIQRYGRLFYSDVEEVLARVRDIGSIQSLDALLLIRCCGDLLVDTDWRMRTKLVNEIWSTIVNLRIPIDVSHFNALLRVYLENNYDFSPIDFLTNLKEKGIEPNKITYQRLILHYCNRGHIEGAMKILEVMKEKGLPLNESIFNALIIGHSEANDIESAKNVLNLMRDVNVEPKASTYSALLQAYAKRGDIETIKNVLKEIESKNVMLCDKDYLDVIHVLAANNHTDEVDEILSMLPYKTNYNMEAVFAILKVLDVGNVDVALKILRTMKNRKVLDKDEAEASSGTFLIRKLVNSKYPAEKIIKACAELEQQGRHSRAFSTAVERSLESANYELSLELLKAWKRHGGTLREHYFWPNIIAHGKASNCQGIYDLLHVMVNENEIPLSFETVKDYVLPYTIGKWDETVKAMELFHVPHATITSSIATRLLSDKKMRKTAKFMTSYPIDYEAEPFYRPLAEALSSTGDANSFAVILRYLCESAVRIHKDHKDGEEVSLPEDVIHTALQTLLEVTPNRKSFYIENVLTNLSNVGLTITPELSRMFREYFGDSATPETYSKIEKLTSDTFTIRPASECDIYNANDDITTESLDGSDYDQTTYVAKRRQLTFALKTKNTPVIKSILKEIESDAQYLSPGTYAQIIQVACLDGDFEMADKWMERFKQEHPDEELDLQKTTLYAGLLIKGGRFDEALNFILAQPRKVSPEAHRPVMSRTLRQLLDIAAETGNVEKTNQLFEALVEANYLSVDNYMLGPLVKVHLVRNDNAGALEAFEKACVTYQCTPLKNELTKRFIDAEDVNCLQRLTDLSTQIHGENNSLADLVLSFLECGRSQQARKILETPKLRLRASRFKSSFDRYLAIDNTNCLDQFIELTKDLQVIDRQELYETVLDAFDKKNNWKRGLSLWTDMQDEDVQPSETFLRTLAALLNRNNQPVPFIYEQRKDSRIEQPEANYMKDFREAFTNGELDKAERILSKVHCDEPDLSSVTSELIEAHVERNNLDKACALVDMALQYKREPRSRALKKLWNALIENKEYEKLRRHSRCLSEFIKSKLRFHKYLIRASIGEHGIEKIVDDIASKITDSKDDNKLIIANGFHFTTFVNELKKSPTALEKFTSLAEKLIEQEIYLPMGIVWCQYFEENKPEADEVWSRYLSTSQWIPFKYISEKSKKENNIDLLERLNQKVFISSRISDIAKMILLSNLIDLYVANNRLDDAVDALNNNHSLNPVHFNEHHRKTIENLKKHCESSGKTFRFQDQDTRQ